MDFELDPPRGVGPLRLGMTAEEATSTVDTLNRDRPSGLRFDVGFGAAGPTLHRVNAIEVWRPSVPDDVVRFRDVDVFGLPAKEVVARIRRHAALEEFESGSGYAAKDLYLAFWRPFVADDDPGEEEGYFFQTVAVARPGYGDTPAEAAARIAAGGEPGY
ncbi:hypothetical protein ACGFJ7_10720 [Actinoplanes sp. NPDC048988]|uniref:hypothetical protein n=1 Tax=Actinoplanes sp. NPDC048988 TaxID=3363901 RepID=UPI003713B1CA